MSLRLLVFSGFALCFFAIQSSPAQITVTSDPVGFTATSCLANSDTYLAVPFTRLPEFSGTIQSVAGSAVTVNGSPGWTTNQFVYSAGSQPKHYFILLGNGGATNPKEGHIYTVTANDSSSLTLDTTFDNVTGVVANTRVTIIPFWTPATVFPAADSSISFTPTTSSGSYQTQLLVPSASTAGINLPSTTYFYSNNVDGTSSNVGWRKVGDGNTVDHGDDPLLPDAYFVLRNQNGAPALTFTGLGSVLMKKIAVPLITSSSQAQDNAVAMPRPVGVPLDFSGLGPIDNSFVTNDQLFVFNNAQPGINKTPSATYTYNNGWRLGSDPTTDHGADVIPPGTAMLIRKAAASGGRTAYWVNSPTYANFSPLIAQQAVSRRAHGSGGPSFDINLPIVGPRGIECRRGSPLANDFQFVATFAVPITSAGAVTVTSADNLATVDAPVISTVNGHGVVTLNLHNIANAQVASLNIVGATDGTNSTSLTVPIGFLLGDTSGDGTVNSADISLAKARSGQSLSVANYRADVTADGSINSADISLVKSRSGTALP